MTPSNTSSLPRTRLSSAAPIQAEVTKVPFEDTFKPCNYFFYGTLMDPDVLKAVTDLAHTPQLVDASLTGFEMKMWNGRYPTLLPAGGTSSTIKGKIWQATAKDQSLSLQRYETSAYETTDCVVRLSNGKEAKAVTFKWARDPRSAQLSDSNGEFDLEYWQKHHKPSML